MNNVGFLFPQTIYTRNLMAAALAAIAISLAFPSAPAAEAEVTATNPPALSAFAPTVPNQTPAPGPAPEGMVWIPGGAFLCTDQYCTRYMTGTRGKGEATTGCNHLGFRCVKDAEPATRRLGASLRACQCDIISKRTVGFFRKSGLTSTS
jgi:formylglycine-generating enzyme required for sulfatase activity